MLMRTDPFRELDRFSQQLFGNLGTISRPTAMPMDARRQGEEFVVEFGLPGVDPESVDLDVERNVLTVRAERPNLNGDHELLAAERPRGVFSRQLILGDNLDTEKVQASYEGGVLTLRIPVAEKAKQDLDHKGNQPGSPDDRRLSYAGPGPARRGPGRPAGSSAENRPRIRP